MDFSKKAVKGLLSVLLLVCFVGAATIGLNDEVPKPFAQQEGILRFEPVSRLHQLRGISESLHHLQRTFLSKEAQEAAKLIQSWMEDAGMTTTWIDNIGNVHGRVDCGDPSAPALLMGSHLDTVIDAGIYDGALGIITAISAVKSLHVSGNLDKFPRPIEIIAFSDEEGVRFQSTFLGSAAVAGKFSENLLLVQDKRGITLETALKTAAFPGTIESIQEIKHDPAAIWGYVEVHIEQGPVLERQGLPLGVVSAIAGQTRLSVKMTGSQGHAGTVPMAMRRDPMAAAAAAVVIIEHVCKNPEELFNAGLEPHRRNHFVNEGALVCTVGEITTWPGASNVIPGEVVFTVDIRAEEDNVRETAVAMIRKRIHDMSQARHISYTIEVKHEASAVHCDPEIQESLNSAAIAALHEVPTSGFHSGQHVVPTIVSGAGHDAMMMAHLTKFGMLFVRCTGGISHSPDEHVLEDDVWTASLALKSFLESQIRQSDTSLE